MKLESIFYIVGGIFAFAAIVYFAFEYLLDFSRLMKIVMLILATIAIYYGARELHRRNM